MKRQIIIIVFGLAGIVSCKKETSAPPVDTIKVEDVAKVASMNVDFAWDIFRQELSAKSNENVLISPWSIQTALTMAANGAGSQTLSEMLNVMHCSDCEINSLNQKHQDLNTLLTKQSGHPTLTIANGYFYDPSRITVKPGFRDKLTESFACGFLTSDFNQEQSALASINGWVKQYTNYKIEKILDKITPLDVAYLINALHFKADWMNGFDPKQTFSSNFTRADGSAIKRDYVTADRNFLFVKNSQFDLVDLPFKDSTYSITLVQSTNKSGTPLDKATFESLINSVKFSRAIVSFPKMKLAYEADLINSLKKLGMNAAFSESAADFTAMGTAKKNIFINQIKHKAVLEVDEKGAEGAAVTAIGFGVTSLPPVLTFNGPYYLILRNLKTNTIVFMGFVGKDPVG